MFDVKYQQLWLPFKRHARSLPYRSAKASPSPPPVSVHKKRARPSPTPSPELAEATPPPPPRPFKRHRPADNDFHVLVPRLKYKPIFDPAPTPPNSILVTSTGSTSTVAATGRRSSRLAVQALQEGNNLSLPTGHSKTSLSISTSAPPDAHAADVDNGSSKTIKRKPRTKPAVDTPDIDDGSDVIVDSGPSTTALRHQGKQNRPRGGAGKLRANKGALFPELVDREQSPGPRYSWDRDMYTVKFSDHSQTIREGMVPLDIDSLSGKTCHSCASNHDPTIFNNCGGPIAYGGKCKKCKKDKSPCSFQIDSDINRHIVSRGLMPIVAADPTNIYNAARCVIEKAALANATADAARLAEVSFLESLRDYHQLAGHQVQKTFPGVWSSSYSSMVPLNDILSLDIERIERNIARLHGHSYGGRSFSVPLASPSRGLAKVIVHPRR